MISLEKQLYALQWGAYEAWSAYGAEVPLAVPNEAADQVSLAPYQLNYISHGLIHISVVLRCALHSH